MAAPALLARPANADVVVSAGADKKVKIWDVKEGKLIKSIDAHDGAVNAVASSPDGKLLATGGADKKVKIWNLKDGSEVKSIDAHTDAVTALAFSPDGKLLITGGADKRVRAWSLPEGKQELSIDAHDKAVTGVSIIPFQGDFIIISASEDGVVKLWDKTGNAIFQIPTEHQGGVKAISGNVKEMCIYTCGADGKMKYWSQGPSGEFEGSHTGAINAVVTLADSTKVLTGGADGKLKIWLATDHKAETTIDTELKGGVTALAVSPDGNMIITGGAEKQVKVWDKAGKLLHTEDAHEGKVTFLLYVADPKEEEKK
jgi:WD40 repeat protein